MIFGFDFFFTNILLGVGLAMDAFSVSVANGLNEPCMKRRKMSAIAAVFAFFQAFMPMIGWFCIHTVLKYFNAFEKFIPWVALALLSFIGGKMIFDCLKNKGDDCGCNRVGFWALILQGIATSIDALSVGLAFAGYDLLTALVASLVIATVTFVICIGGLIIGKKAGTHLADKAGFFGGAILILIGIEIFIKGIIR